jgi:hypothetical protein
MKINNIDVKIGDKIRHTFGHYMSCSERFPTIFSEDLEDKGRCTDAVPACLSGEGYIIGIKMAIMSEYKYTPGKTYGPSLEEAYAEHVPGYSSGKKEECLVVTKSIKPFRPYLVRKKDVI